MLQIIERKDMPGRRGSEKSEVRVFADTTVSEFMDMVKGPEVVEVSGWPIDETRDAIWNAARARSEISKALFHWNEETNMRKKIKVSRSGTRVFMERIAPYKSPANPYPGDFPKVR